MGFLGFFNRSGFFANPDRNAGHWPELPVSLEKLEFEFDIRKREYSRQPHIADKPAWYGILPNKIRRIIRTSVIYYGQSRDIPWVASY